MKLIHQCLTSVFASLVLMSPAMGDDQKKQINQPTKILVAMADVSLPNLPQRPSTQSLQDRLPSIYVVKPQHVGNMEIRGTIVAKVNCPITVATGIVPPPIDFAIANLEKVAMFLNQKEFFKYDVQFVCG